MRGEVCIDLIEMDMEIGIEMAIGMEMETKCGGVLLRGEKVIGMWACCVLSGIEARTSILA